MDNKIEWLKERKTYIGGSDIGAILGANKHMSKNPRSAMDVYLDKTSESIKEIDSEAAYWGIALEDIVAGEYSKRTNFNIEKSDGVIRHHQYSFIAANIDRWVNNKQHILECKTAGFMKKEEWGEVGTDQIPASYLCQVAYYAAITGVEKVDIAVLIGGQEFRIYTYKRDLDLQDKLIKVAYNFWNNNILKRIPPEVNSLPDANKLYSRSNGTQIEANEDLIEKVDNLKELRHQERFISSKMNDLQFEIKKYMQNNEVLIDNSGEVKVTWKSTNSRLSLDTKKLQEEHQNIYQQYLIEKDGSRMFLIK